MRYRAVKCLQASPAKLAGQRPDALARLHASRPCSNERNGSQQIGRSLSAVPAFCASVSDLALTPDPGSVLQGMMRPTLVGTNLHPALHGLAQHPVHHEQCASTRLTSLKEMARPVRRGWEASLRRIRSTCAEASAVPCVPGAAGTP